MADNNETVERVQLDPTSFGEGLDFGIQDTMTVGAEDLQAFLTSDTLPSKDAGPIVKAEEAKQKDIPKVEENKPAPEENKGADEGKQNLEAFLKEELKDDNPGNTTNAGKTNSDPEEDNTYEILSQDFLNLGVFTQEDGEEPLTIKTPQEFLERVKVEQKKGAIDIVDNFLSRFGEDYRRMFDAVFVKGVNPKDYLPTYVNVASIKDLDLDEEDNQVRVLRQYYKSIKKDDEWINTRISKLRDLEDLRDEASTYHELLVEREAENEQKLIKDKEDSLKREKQYKAYNKNSYETILAEKLTKKDFDGIPLTAQEVHDTVSYLTGEDYKLPNGDLISEFDKDILELNKPENHNLKIKLALLLRKKLDLKGIKKVAVSEESEKLFNLNARQAPKNKDTPNPNKSFF